MKQAIRYCQKCEDYTRQDVTKWNSGFSRLFFGVFTLGMAEALNETIYTCQVCGGQVVRD